MSAGSLREALSVIPPVEWIAVALALAYLVFAVRQHIACWFFAAASSAIFLWLFARAGLAMQSLLQLFYIAMAAYGWYSWRGGRSSSQESRPVVRWPLRRHLAAVAGILLVSTSAWVWAAGDSASVRYVDAVTAWGSVLATWLVARKVLENWLYWIVLDLMAAGLYWSQDLLATALLFVLYSAIAVHGYRSWRASLKAPRPVTAVAGS